MHKMQIDVNSPYFRKTFAEKKGKSHRQNSVRTGFHGRNWFD